MLRRVVLALLALVLGYSAGWPLFLVSDSITSILVAVVITGVAAGGVLPVMNTLIGIGLEEAGLTDEARMIRNSTAELIRQSGFSEYYDPCDGSPAGGKDFTWTAAVWLAWVSR